MDGTVTHQEYYSSVALAARIMINRELAERTQKALAAGDEHLNTIPLAMWDHMARALQSILHKALQEHGDSYSLAGGVCTLKIAAKVAANKL